MITPQPTAQYGQVLRVSVVRSSLKLRVSARTAVGEKAQHRQARPGQPGRADSKKLPSVHVH